MKPLQCGRTIKRITVMADRYLINDRFWMQQMLQFQKLQSGYVDGTVTAVAPSIDKFGRTRSSLPYTVFDSKQIGDNRTFFWTEEQVSGSGTTGTYNINDSSTTLSVTAATAGRRVRQTRQRHNYQPGKSQRNIFTGVLGSGDASVNLRTYSTGSAVDTQIARENWNIDKLDGTGESRATVDFSKSQIMVIDFEWLGVGDIWFGVFSGGALYYCHVIQNANQLTGVFMTTPNLPIRYEIDSDGATVTKRAGAFDDRNGLFFAVANETAGTDSIKHICTTVQSEGGQELTGIDRYISTNGTHVDADTPDTTYAVLGIRLKSTHIENVVKVIEASMFSETNDNFEWLLIYNPTVAGTFAYTALDNSPIEYARGATANTVTGGTVMNGGWSASSNSVGQRIQNLVSIGSSIARASDQIVLCVRPLSSNSDIQGSLTWTELA